MPALRAVFVQQCDVFDDADAVATLPALTSLQLCHLPKLTRYAAIAVPPNLELLGLFGATIPMRWVGQHKDRETIRRIQGEARGG